MGLISAIVPSARRPGRFDVLVDGCAAATVPLETVDRLQLRVGRRYDEVRLQVEQDAAAQATYDRALNMLALRARSSRDLRRQLLRKGEPSGYVDSALARLEAAGLLDDDAFARQLARSKAVGVGMSRRRIGQELARRGIGREIGERAIADVFEDEQLDEAAIAEAVARRKLRSLGALDEPTRRRRLYAFLARRGYDLDDIRRAIDAIAADAADL